MSRRQDGPGSYTVFFPLAHRKKKNADVIKVENLDPGEKVPTKSNGPKNRQPDPRRKHEKDKALITIQATLSSDTKSAKVVANKIGPNACDAFCTWVDSISVGQLMILPDCLRPLFGSSARHVVERHFERWLCQKIPAERSYVVDRLRRQVNELLLNKSKQYFRDPHREVSDFVAKSTVFDLYELGFTSYSPNVISRLSNELRRNGKMIG